MTKPPADKVRDFVIDHTCYCNDHYSAVFVRGKHYPVGIGAGGTGDVRDAEAKAKTELDSLNQLRAQLAAVTAERAEKAEKAEAALSRWIKDYPFNVHQQQAKIERLEKVCKVLTDGLYQIYDLEAHPADARKFLDRAKQIKEQG